MRIAFLFAGQGAQYTGMGRELCETSAAARAVFEMAEAIRPGTADDCFFAPKEALSRTIRTQPCVFAVDLAAARALAENGITPEAAAGFSLGELAALTFAGALTDREGFRLTVKRAELMQAEAARTPSGMAAILKLPAEAVIALCAQTPRAYPVNFNCPGQTVVAGEQAALDALAPKVAQAGGRMVPLAVNGGFHSPLMEGVAKALEAELSRYTFKLPRCPVYSNRTAAPYAPPFGPGLARQAASPVLWQKTVQRMLADGIDTFVEVGPGRTLREFLKKIAPEIEAVYNVQDRDSLTKTLVALKPGGTDA